MVEQDGGGVRSRGARSATCGARAAKSRWLDLRDRIQPAPKSADHAIGAAGPPPLGGQLRRTAAVGAARAPANPGGMAALSESVPGRHEGGATADAGQLTCATARSRELTRATVPSRSLGSTTARDRALNSAAGRSHEVGSAAGRSHQVGSAAGRAPELGSAAACARPLASATAGAVALEFRRHDRVSPRRPAGIRLGTPPRSLPGWSSRRSFPNRRPRRSLPGRRRRRRPRSDHRAIACGPPPPG